MTLLLSDLFLDYKSHWIIIGRQGHIEASSGENDIRIYVKSRQAV